jgi:hypothetical protein
MGKRRESCAGRFGRITADAAAQSSRTRCQASAGDGVAASRTALGGMPMIRLKARLKDASES